MCSCPSPASRSTGRRRPSTASSERLAAGCATGSAVSAGDSASAPSPVGPPGPGNAGGSRRLRTIAAATPSAAPIAIASPALLLGRIPCAAFGHGLRFLHFRLVRLSFKFRLAAFRLFAATWVGKSWLQGCGTVCRRLVPRLFALFAPLVAVACPSSHVALVTRPARLEQSR